MKQYFEVLLEEEELLLQRLKETGALCPPPRDTPAWRGFSAHLAAQEAIVDSIKLVINGGDVDDLIGAYNAQIESIDLLISAGKDPPERLWRIRAGLLSQVARLTEYQKIVDDPLVSSTQVGLLN
jgi:hypothetical protein